MRKTRAGLGEAKTHGMSNEVGGHLNNNSRLVGDNRLRKGGRWSTATLGELIEQRYGELGPRGKKCQPMPKEAQRMKTAVLLSKCD